MTKSEIPALHALLIDASDVGIETSVFVRWRELVGNASKYEVGFRPIADLAGVSHD